MARVLLVGCGCRGRSLASALVERGHAVRGTTRSEGSRRAIAAAGAEPALADPARLSTLMPHLEGVGVLCWLLGTAIGPPDALADLHGPRLESMLQAIVDAPVRGVVYEGVGSVAPDVLERGAAIARRAGQAHSLPVEVIYRPHDEHAEWLAGALDGIDRVLGSRAVHE